MKYNLINSRMESQFAKLGLTSAFRKDNQIHENVLACIGSTPLIRVNNIIEKEKLKCDLLVK